MVKCFVSLPLTITISFSNTAAARSRSTRSRRSTIKIQLCPPTWAQPKKEDKSQQSGKVLKEKNYQQPITITIKSTQANHVIMSFFEAVQ